MDKLATLKGKNMSINLMSSKQTIDYLAYRNGIDGTKITEPFYEDIKNLEGAGRSRFVSLTQEALSQTSTSIKITNFGYEVDENGFFGTDLNDALGIPQNIKIHQAMVAQASAYTQAQGESIEPLQVISNIWKLFSTIAGNTLDPDKDGYITQKEINAMPKSYISKGSLMDGIVSVQRNSADAYAAANTSYNIAAASDGTLDSGFRGFMLYGAYSRIDTDPEIALFGHREIFEEYSGVEYDENLPADKITVGELFDSFFYQKVDGETAAYVYDKADINSQNLCSINPNATKNFYKYLESGQDMKTYLEDTKGTDYLNSLIKRLGTIAGGDFVSELVDEFFANLDKAQKELYAQYKANQYPELGQPAKLEDISGTVLSATSLASKLKFQNKTIGNSAVGLSAALK